jgi:hypothetical protein
MLEKRKCQRARFPNPRHTPANCIEDFAKVPGAAVGKFLSFDIAPESLYRIQIGSVTRQPLHAEPTVLTIEEVRHDPALVRREAVPNQDRFGSVEVTLEVLQKGDQTFGVVGAAARLEEEAAAPAIPMVAERRADRETGPVESVDQDRGFAFGCPGSPDGWALRYPAFVLEEDPRFSATSVFFTAGHFSDIQSLIASGLRSLACLAGRCSVQSITPRSFQT